MLDAIDISCHVVKKYICDDGEIYMTHSDEFYGVTVIQFNFPGSQSHYMRGRMDYISATEFFDIACRYVNGEIEWTEPVRKFSCKYNPNKSKGCTNTNCPRALGGATYREFFGLACPYRKSRTR